MAKRSKPIKSIELNVVNNLNSIDQEMNIMRDSLISMLLALILLTCVSGVQAQVPDQMLSATSKVDVSQYSQYYSMQQGSTPTTHIVAPEKYDINGKVPTEQSTSDISSKQFPILNTRLWCKLPLDSGSHELDSIRNGSPGFKLIASSDHSPGRQWISL
jgi:hypothetical protein